MGILYSRIVDAYNQAITVYNEAIQAKEKIDTVLDSIAVDDKELYVRTVKIQDTFVQVINAAWHAKYAAEQLLGDIQQDEQQ